MLFEMQLQAAEDVLSFVTLVVLNIGDATPSWDSSLFSETCFPSRCCCHVGQDGDVMSPLATLSRVVSFSILGYPVVVTIDYYTCT